MKSVANITERRAYYSGGYNHWHDLTIEVDPKHAPDIWCHKVFGVRLESAGQAYMVGHTLHGTLVESRDGGETWATVERLWRNG